MNLQFIINLKICKCFTIQLFSNLWRMLRFAASIISVSVLPQGAVIWGKGIRRTVRVLPSVPVALIRDLMSQIVYTGWFNTYCGWVNFLAPVGYLGLIWVMSGANHGTRGGWDATGPNGIGARLADWHSLLFKPRPFAYTTGTPFGVRRPWNCWTTWEIGEKFSVRWISVTISRFQN